MWVNAVPWTLVASWIATAPPAPARPDLPAACPITLEPSAHPQTMGVGSTVGYDGAYSKSGLVVPEPIPFTVDATDQDKILVHCNEVCHPEGVPGVWTAGWTRETPSGLAPGDFIDAEANLVETEEGSAVMFLPPKDLSPGQSRETYVTAMIVDDCSIPGFADNPVEVIFRIDVARDAGGLFSVTAVEDTINNPPQSAPNCSGVGSTAPCQLRTTRSIGDPPILSIDQYPTAGMILGEMRVLHGGGEDPDEMHGECGTPPGVTPTVSNYGFQRFCDELEYTWSVIQGPGNGVFASQGRSTLFRATAPGSVTVVLLALAPDGEVEQEEVTFTIFEPRVEYLTYGANVPTRLDKTGYVPNGADWRDKNGDGDADDAGEHHFHVAYEPGTAVTIADVTVECGTPVPPYALFHGLGSDAIEFSGPRAPSFPGLTELYAFDLTGSGTVPTFIHKYDPFEIDWSLSFGDDYFVPAGTTDNWLYVTLAPTNSLYTYESVLEISCLAAAGENDPATAYTKIWQAFQAPSPGAMPPAIHTKSRDGFNTPDGKRLGYLRPGEPESSGFGGMLGYPEGNGNQWAWSGLFQACLKVHGNATTQPLLVNWDDPYTPSPMLLQSWRKNEPYLCVGDHGVAESTLAGDDTPVVPLGQGQPHGPAIHPGSNGLQTTPVPDDATVAFNGLTWIGTGPDGLCDTPAAAGDTQVVPVGEGLPHRASTHPMAIGAGVDGVLQSAAGGDDHVQATIGRDTSLLVAGEVIEAIGLPGHDNPDPPSVFNDHVVIEHGGMIYDASYGLGPFPSKSAWEDALIFGLVQPGAPTFCDLQELGVEELIYTPVGLAF